MGKLRDQMLADLQLCGAKPRTQETYLREAETHIPIIWWPSKHVMTEAVSPGMFTSMEVVEPPYIAP